MNFLVRTCRSWTEIEQMTETEMALLLEKQIAKLHEAGADMSMDQTFFRVGEWLLAFEGVYVMNRKLPASSMRLTCRL